MEVHVFRYNAKKNKYRTNKLRNRERKIRNSVMEILSKAIKKQSVRQVWSYGQKRLRATNYM